METPLVVSSFQHPLAGKRIVVAGAGPAGLAFAISLRSMWKEETMGISPEVIHYERDERLPHPSREGYSISIRCDKSCAGVQTLNDMKIYNALRAVSVIRDGNERGYHGYWSLDWRRLVRVREKPSSESTVRMRIGRIKLRRILLDAASKYGQINWGVGCTGVLPNADGSTAVTLSTGKTVECDFLVVADGANSKLRACIRPHDKLNFAGPVSISAISRFSGRPPDPTSQDWGIVPSGQGVALFAAPMDENSANWSLSYMSDAPRQELRQPLPKNVNNELLSEARRSGAVFREPFHTLVQNTDLATLMVFNAMDKDPFLHGAANGVPDGIVFIGDSNHAVSPFAANGANLALLDGYDLAECLCSHATIEEAIQVYDRRSLPRAARSLRNSHVSIAIVHSKGLMWAFYHSCLLLMGSVMSIWYFCKDWSYQLLCH
jgi:2-polyprenyl-6-methoxyphenol hydroxylase-like FAD-dependent oxidoreductase